ncbi:MAG: Rho termination factor N-terminal domain-containing protein, partial [Candidatus Nanopelagicales bacterium]
MSDTTTDVVIPTSSASDSGDTPAKPNRRAGTGLNSMLLPELKALASSLGIKGTTGMRKSQLVEVITANQSGSARTSAPGRRPAAKSAA